MIAVEWYNAHPDACNPKAHWDTAWLQHVFAHRLPSMPYHDRDSRTWGSRVVMVAGRFHSAPRDVAALNEHLRGCGARGALIIHSDEESLLDPNMIDAPNMTLWVMTPRPDFEYPERTRFIGEGWSPGTPEVVAAWGARERLTDIHFRGQITHERRVAMAHAEWEEITDRLILRGTPGFTQGIQRAAYLGELTASKVVLCPSGPATQDSFRVFEALEAGCVPLVDDVTPDGRTGYWEFVFPGAPFPTITDWSTAPHVARNVLAQWDELQPQCVRWWAEYQEKMIDRLASDVERYAMPL